MDYVINKNRIVYELYNNLKKELNEKFVRFSIFGSVARGEETKNSDIDIYLVVKDREARKKAIHVYTEFEMNLTKYDEREINLIVEIEEYYKNQIDNSANLFYRNLREEEIVIQV